MLFVVLWLYFLFLFWKFIPKLDRIKHFQIVICTCERKKKYNKNPVKGISQNTSQILCDIFAFAGLPSNGITSVLCEAEGNAYTQWVPESCSIYQTWISVSLNLESLQFLLEEVRHQCF